MIASLKQDLNTAAVQALQQLFQIECDTVEIQQTRKEFEGDFTIVVFPYLKQSRKSPEATAQALGEYLQENMELVERFNVVKGFLNLLISDRFWVDSLYTIGREEQYGHHPVGSESILVEYSSPNTNKPLHLGHIRNNLLGFSVSRLLEAAGHKVIKAQIINDRGIHICKSMLAWKLYGEGESPESSGLKGDKLVGKYYVIFDQKYREEVAERMSRGEDKESAEANSTLMAQAREMLLQWEAGEPETVALWKKMNAWVYAGFEKTYARLGVDFDYNYYESETYLLGKEEVLKGLDAGVFYKKEDGSVWVDLSDAGLDHKLLLRKDGTSVYMTQDIGTAIQRFRDYEAQNLSGMIYTVGNEQDYHFKVLFEVLKKLGYTWADNLFHLSYGMVDLPSGKMKSREGTVVDADDLMDEMHHTAAEISQELGKTEGMNEAERESLYEMVGMGALKYYMLKVDPKKRMLFNPEESVDFQGNTGPFIQYTHARIHSLLSKAAERGVMENEGQAYGPLEEIERQLLVQLNNYPELIQQSAEEKNPSAVAAYAYDLVKLYNALYQQLPILTDENTAAVAFRIYLSTQVAKVIKDAMYLLGIDVPKRM